MNYLAHIKLSGNNEEILLGNFMGDFVKGSHYNRYNNQIKKGILLHRFIDDFTDSHAKVKEDVKLLSKHIGRYAPVALDVYYDHLLTQNWEQFESQSLHVFCDDFYSTISKHKELLPDKCKFMFTYMKRDNWLKSYQNVSGVGKVLERMAKRAKYQSNLEHSIKHILDHKKQIDSGFVDFFNDITLKSKQFING